jgi:hypothetical protein
MQGNAEKQAETKAVGRASGMKEGGQNQVTEESDFNASDAGGKGLCSRAFSELARELGATEPACPWVCRCSAVEIYNDQCIDLLVPAAKSLLTFRDSPTLLQVNCEALNSSARKRLN